jgi:predicted ATPase/DNA-binding SARP family transcriptional activator
MARLAFALLGPLHVTLDDQPVSGFGYDKARALLAYLALEAQAHRRDALAALLWPDQTATAARTSLRVALSTLRRALGDQAAQSPFLLITREIVQFNPAGDVSVDVAAFAELVRACEQHGHPHASLCQACVTSLTTAVALYRGELLQQVVVRDSVMFEEWLTLRRERLHRQAIEALGQLMAFFEAQGQDETARQYAWRTLALEGWDEAAHRCLIRVLSRSGQRAAALAQYERCRKVLVEELGVEPAAETTTLYKRIEAGELAAAVGVRARPDAGEANPNGHALVPRETTGEPVVQVATQPRTNLSTPLTPLIGREREVDAVSTLLGRTDVRLVTLSGPGGVGKTRLGLQVGAAVRDLFADGIFFVPLAPISDPDLVVAAITQTLDVKEMGGQLLIECLTVALRDKQLLLILDNFEHLGDAAPRIAELLAAVPGIKALVTSRVVLRLSGEHEFPVSPLTLPDLVVLPSVETLGRIPAVALFVERARAVKPDFVLTTANARAVAEICARVDGLPLAIELAAARVKLFSPQALLARLGSRLKTLTSGARDLPARQQTLRATIDWSYNLLTAAEQTLFARLGVFVGGCTLEAAEVVCNSNIGLEIAVLDGLAALVDKSLLQREEEPGSELRFTMLETIREYALEQLVTHGELAGAQQQHASYYLGLGELAETGLSGPEQMVWLAQLECEYTNLRAVLQWAVEHGAVETGLSLAAALRLLWSECGHVAEGRKWLEEFLGSSSRQPFALRAKALYVAGHLATMQGDYPGAHAPLRESLALSRALGDKHGIATTLNVLGFTAIGQGDHQQAMALLEESRALFQELGNKEGMALSLLRLGTVMYLQGDYAWAVAMCQESLTLVQEQDNKLLMAWTLKHLGNLAQRQGDARQAVALLGKSLALFQEAGHIVGLTAYMEGMAEVAALQNQPERLVRLFGAAAQLHTLLGVPPFPAEQVEYDRQLLVVRAQLGEGAFDAAWAKGQAMPLEQAIAAALDGNVADAYEAGWS